MNQVVSSHGLFGRVLSWLNGVPLRITLLSFSLAGTHAAESSSASALVQEIRRFQELGSVLHIAAHPDDENTQLLAYLARSRNYRTAYLSLTRGDGGQNLLGPEFGEKLGVARTQELLAARRLDGSQQFFTRALDFGFSKDYRETLTLWDRQQIVSDIVRVIRRFRPDILITRFSPQPGGTHGHHTASAVLALEAFKLAGDPTAFPEQLQDLTPWQPKRILWNGRSGAADTNGLRIGIGGDDPVLGISLGELAGRSRAMHKTQGFGNFGGGGGGARSEAFQLLAGEPAANDLLDGVDTTWNRVPGGAEVGPLAQALLTQFNPKDIAASVPALLVLRTRLAALPSDPLVPEKRLELDRILQACLGLEIRTTLSASEVVPGESLPLHHTATVHGAVPVRWIGVRYPTLGRELKIAVNLAANEPMNRDSRQVLPTNTPLTQPYWLRNERMIGMFRVDDVSLIGRPENPPIFPVENIFEIAGQTLVIADEPREILTNSPTTETRRKLDVIPPASLQFTSEVELFSPGKARSVAIEITANRPDTVGTLQLDVPIAWQVAPSVHPFKLGAIGTKKRIAFTVTAPPQATTATLRAQVEIQGVRWQNQRIEVRYDHIPLQLLQPSAQLKAVSLELAIRGQKIGYLAGAGDSVAESLTAMGYEVAQLSGADLTPQRLPAFDAVVVGVRAMNTRTDLVAQLPALFAYVEAGGNVIFQYNRPDGLKASNFTPYPLRLSGDRVTEENAAVTLLAPEHPALTTPNLITGADFDGWVQERGVYFPNQWDPHFTPILSCHDAEEAPLSGGLLVARHGQGYFVYTGLAFFRQLPAGVPGAYRLLANLVSLGK